MQNIIGFSGKFGCGKTTLSNAFANDIDARFVSFGEYIREITKKRNLDYQDRKILQTIGEEQIMLGWTKFCRDMLEFFDYDYNKTLVIDGVRHIGCLEGLQFIFPDSKIFLVYINISNELSADRQIQRGDNSIYTYSDSAKINITEDQVATCLPLKADLILDGNNEMTELRAELNLWYANLK